jgi:hypothetical protein
MAAKRPIRTFAYKRGLLIKKGRAATLNGAIRNNVKRLMENKAAVVEITTARERLLATVRWTMSLSSGRPTKAISIVYERRQ